MKTLRSLWRRSWMMWVLFLCALAIRLYFFAGFILCDDAEELGLVHFIMQHGANLQGPLQYRFPTWIFNYLSEWIFGFTEWAYFLPTWIASASLPVIAYLILSGWGYSAQFAFLGGLVLVVAPFEVVSGTLRANDLFLSFFIALALHALVTQNRRPYLQGGLIALWLWFAFYTKLWAVYLFPALGVWFAYRFLRFREWKTLAAVTFASLGLHGAICLFWRYQLGSFFPFLDYPAAHYPMSMDQLGRLFLEYPRLILNGSEYQTTLFGWVPHLTVLLMIGKLSTILRRFRGSTFRWDPRDTLLFCAYSSFFLFLNFFPNSYKFDHYYSAPRIFRYLFPFSFLLTLHLAKMTADLASRLRYIRVRRWAVGLTIAPMLLLLAYQAALATAPGRMHRRELMAVVEEVRLHCPPQLLIESWQSHFLRNIYLRDACPADTVTLISEIHAAKDYEKWLQDYSSTLPPDTLLVTGLGSCVFYSCYGCGFRLRYFDKPLDPAWSLAREFGELSFHPYKEPVRLWKYQPAAASATNGEISPPEAVRTKPGFDATFKMGMMLFEGGKHREARTHFHSIVSDPAEPAIAEDAAYFYAVTFWRENEYRATVREFRGFLDRFPGWRWTAAAYYHMGMAHQQLREHAEARKLFERILSEYGQDANLCQLSRDRLAELPALSWWQRWRPWGNED